MHLVLNNKDDVTPASLKKLKDLVINKNTLLMNHASWCSHCQVFRPEWEQFKDTKESRKVNLVEIEAEALTELQKVDKKTYKRVISNDGVVYFPMIMIFVKKVDAKTSQKKMYEGNRSVQGISEYVTSKIKKVEAKATKKSATKTSKPAIMESEEKVEAKAIKKSATKTSKPAIMESEDSMSHGGLGSMSLFALNRELDMILRRLNIDAWFKNT